MKRFEKTKGFILGIMVSLMVSSVMVNVNAQPIMKQLTAYFNGIKLVVAGETVVSKNANGEVIEPFVVDGTTYLPIRAIAEALGQTVSWDKNSNTVYIGTNEAAAQPAVWLNEMNTLSGNYLRTFAVNGAVKDNTGKSYENYLAEMSQGSVTYAINGQYNRLTGTLVLLNKDSHICYRLKVLLDDRLVYTSDEITKDILPFDFEIDTKNAQKLTMIWEYDYLDTGDRRSRHEHGNFVISRQNSEVAIVNAGLWK